MINKNKRYKNGDNLSVHVAESEKRIIETPEYVLFMDKIIFPDATYTVISVNKDEIVLSSQTTVKKEALEKWIKGAKIERADCFERG